MDKRQLQQPSFTKPFWVSLGIVAILFSVLAIIIIQIDAHDVLKYQELKASSNPQESSRENAQYIYKQFHEKPSKNLYLVCNENRLHSRLRSDKAELHLICDGDHTKVIEEMSAVFGDIQEKVESLGDELFQTVRHFETKQAVYDYEMDLLKADAVYVERYASPGDSLYGSDLSKRILLKGDAKQMECSLTSKEMSLTAYQLDAAILESESDKDCNAQ